MRTTINGHMVEGTPEEIAKLLSFLESASPPSIAIDGTRASPFVSEDVAVAVLTRRELGDTHAKMLRLLAKAGDNWTAAPELQRTLGLTTREFAGALGAFGRRVSHTEGTSGRSFLDQYWDSQNGYNLYRLPVSVRAALHTAKLI